MPTRRDVLTALAAAFAAPRSLGALAEGRAERPTRAQEKLVIGVQLYTLRAEMRRDPEATISRIAELGFADIEWWGNFGRTAPQLRALLDHHGLQSTAAHVDQSELTPDRLPALLDRADTMGHKALIVAWTPPTQRGAADWERLAALLSNAGRAAAARGITTGYHNHDFEFTNLDGRSAWAILVGASDPAVVSFELDVFWAVKAAEDPLAMLRQHAPRITRLHLKDTSGPPAHRQMDVGAGVIDWAAVLALAASVGVSHAYVEHDEPVDAWAAASAGREYLRSLGY